MTLSTQQRSEARTALADINGGVCAWPGCQVTEGLDVDHIKAVVNGGTDDLTNLQLLCASHNRSKGAGASLLGTEDGNQAFLQQIKEEGAELYDETVQTLKTFVYVSEEWPYSVMALWVFVAQEGLREYLTHLPLLSVTSPRPAMGKSVTTRILHTLLPESARYSTLSNHKALIRGQRSAYVLDEIKDMEPWKGEFHAYLNASVEAGAVVPINEPKPEGGWEPKDFPAFTAFVLGGLNQHLAEDTLTRAIRITMEEMPPTAHIEEYDHAGPEAEAVAALGQRIAAWAEKVGPFIVAEYGVGLRRKRTVPSFLRGRDRDKWSSIFAIATLLGPVAQADALMAALDYADAASEGRIKSEVETFVDCLGPIIDKDETVSVNGFVPTKHLIEALAAGYPDEYGNQATRQLKGQKLGHLLQSIGGPQARQVRVDGFRNPPRGYWLKELREALRKAMPDDAGEGEAMSARKGWTKTLGFILMAFLLDDTEGDVEVLIQELIDEVAGQVKSEATPA